jgi:hypothetical protein
MKTIKSGHFFNRSVRFLNLTFLRKVVVGQFILYSSFFIQADITARISIPSTQ